MGSSRLVDSELLQMNLSVSKSVGWLSSNQIQSSGLGFDALGSHPKTNGQKPVFHH